MSSLAHKHMNYFVKDDIPKDRLHPALKEAEDECHYIGEWGDCDPFRMIRLFK